MILVPSIKHNTLPLVDFIPKWIWMDAVSPVQEKLNMQYALWSGHVKLLITNPLHPPPPYFDTSGDTDKHDNVS